MTEKRVVITPSALNVQRCDLLQRPLRIFEGQISQRCDESACSCFRELLQAVLHRRAIAPDSAHDSDIELCEIPADRRALALEFIDARLQLPCVQLNRAPSVGPFRNSLEGVLVEATDQYRRPRFLRRLR